MKMRPATPPQHANTAAMIPQLRSGSKGFTDALTVKPSEKKQGSLCSPKVFRRCGEVLWWISITLPFAYFLVFLLPFCSLNFQEVWNPLGWIGYTYILFLGAPMVFLSCFGLVLMKKGKTPDYVAFRRSLIAFCLLGLLSNVSSWLSECKRMTPPRSFVEHSISAPTTPISRKSLQP